MPIRAIMGITSFRPAIIEDKKWQVLARKWVQKREPFCGLGV